MASPGHGQEQGAHARHSPCCCMPERCSQTQRAMVVPVAMMSSHLGPLHARAGHAGLLGKTQGTLRKGQAATSWPSHTHTSCAGCTVGHYESRADGIMYFWDRAWCQRCWSLIDVRLLPAPCPPVQPVVRLNPWSSWACARTHTHARLWIPPIAGFRWSPQLLAQGTGALEDRSPTAAAGPQTSCLTRWLVQPEVRLCSHKPAYEMVGNRFS